ncbi:MAG: zinc-ribbon domain-containing protein [Tenericutes bacterium]|nr:zinc-ribbon domain-containing protein [Mycoplasmatota bacterium]
MEYCNNCGTEIDVYDKFCSQCGNQVKKSSTYESRATYEKQKIKRKTKYGAARHGMSSIFGSAALFFAILNFFSAFFTPVLSVIFAFAAILTSFKERRRDYYSQIGIIFAIMAIGINFLAFLIPMGLNMFFRLF